MESDTEDDSLLAQLGLASRLFMEKGSDAAFPELSSCLEYLLGRRWVEAGLVPVRSFDGLACAKITKRSADDLEVLGMMIDIETQETEMFHALLSLAPESATLRSYSLRHGLVGVAPVPYNSSMRNFEEALLRMASWNWIHEFQG